MKVRELIEQLSTMDSDLDVVIHSDCEVTDAEVMKPHYQDIGENGFPILCKCAPNVVLGTSCYCGSSI